MKKLLYVMGAIFMATPLTVLAQVTPLFQFTLYAEDSLGNRDSVLLGYDLTASSQNLNIQFGEAHIPTPFDSILDMRAIHGDDFLRRTSKIIIENAETLFFDSTCTLSAETRIVIHAKYPPVHFFYDSSLFPVQSCKNVILTRDWDIFFLENWSDVCDFHCMSDSSFYIEQFSDPEPPFNQCWNYLKIEKEVQGQGLKELPGLFLATFYGPGPCNDPTFLDADQKPVKEGFTLYPNPCSAFFLLETASPESIAQVLVMNVAGQIVPCPIEKRQNGIRVNAEGLLRGLYFVLVRDSAGRASMHKLVKN
jgi:hypothetical protein